MKENHWSIHLEFLVIFVTLLGGYFLIDSKVERQGQQTDRLYEMFYDAQNDYHQKFYELLMTIKK
jgi:hypothetical protein